MTYSLSRSEKAKGEFRDAYLFYKSESQELADRFILAVEETLDGIQQNPLMYPKEIKEYRKALIGKRFPYNVFYRLDGNIVVVISIYHTSREPNEWEK